LQTLPVHVSLVWFARGQIKYRRMGQFRWSEAFVDLMEDGAGKQQILEYQPFFRPRFEEYVLSGLSGAGEDKMSERKNGSQTVIDAYGLLDLRMQMLHLPFDCRHMQLGPGIS